MSERPLEHREAPGELAAGHAHVDGGRLGVYAAIGATVGTVPLPWVPGALVRRVRGALVHDVAGRHGLSLSPEARRVLADVSSPDSPDGTVTRALRYASKRLALRALTRVGPLRALFPIGQALQVYALGALLDRYLRTLRLVGSPDAASARIEREEALRVRRAIDHAIAGVLDAAPAGPDEAARVDDGRDRVTALVDGLLGAAAGVPAQLMHRLYAAFDAQFSAAP
jgi:hypothetical protein